MYTCQVDKCQGELQTIQERNIFGRPRRMSDHFPTLRGQGRSWGYSTGSSRPSGLCPLSVFTHLFLLCRWEVLWEESQDPGALSLSNASNKQQPGTIFFQHESKPGTINSCSLYSGWQLPLPHSSWPRAVKAKGST